MKRYIAMSIPGRKEDSSDTLWYVYDRQAMWSLFECESWDAAQECAKLANGE